MIPRRDLLRFFAASAGCAVISANRAEASPRISGDTPSPYSFPQGVASADPQSDAVVLWTRLEGANSASRLTVQVATSESFEAIVAQQDVLAVNDFDYTVRVLVTGLESDRYYFYRFIDPAGRPSRTGRTRTAPAEGADSLRVAVFSCQDYEQGYFTAYRRLILDDAAAPPGEKTDFVLHVGDFVYESIRGPDTVAEPDHNGRRLRLTNRDGSLRRCAPFPSGGRLTGRKWLAPQNLADYRWLYKRYLSDPDLQDARALFPFVQTWDDHELMNDYWQSYYKNRSVAELKVASNQAWFEFVPAALSSGGRDGQPSHARDFEAVDVAATPPGDFDDDYFSQEPNNRAAVESMTIYRSLRWGKLAELFVIDGRSYRGPRGLPQELLSIGRHPYPEAPVDPDLIRTLSAGKTARNGRPPSTVEYLGRSLPNPRQGSPAGSMLGGRQKDWLKSGLVNSNARWKLLGLNVGLMRHGFDDSFRDGGHKNGILWTDGWDGYPVERAELCTFIRDSRLANVVSLTGDRHAHMAGTVADDHDAPEPRPVLPEFAGGAVSAVSRMIIQRELSAHDPELAALVSFAGGVGDTQTILPALNAWMLYGATAARALAAGADELELSKLADSAVNPHMQYVDADAHGYLVARFTASECKVEFVSVFEPVDLEAASTAKPRRRVRFAVPAWDEGAGPELRISGVEGEPPRGGLKL